MKKAKKKQLIISKEFKKKIHENIYSYGMQPYNAVCVAGVKEGLSPGKIKIIAEKLENSALLKLVFRNGIDDIAQRNYASLDNRMYRLSLKAGLRPDEEGCKKTVSAGESFVDVDDNGAQIECIKELNRMTRTTSSAGDPDEKEDMVVNIKISVEGREGTGSSTKSFMGIKANTERSNTGGC